MGHRLRLAQPADATISCGEGFDTDQRIDGLVLPGSDSVGLRFMIPLVDDSREGIVAALEIRKDRTPTVLRRLAKAEADTRGARRILAIANALDGMSREQAARSAGMDRQTLRDWVLRYNEHGIDGLADRWGDGRPPTFDAQEQAELMRIVLDGPDPEVSGLSVHARGPGQYLRAALRQADASLVARTAAQASGVLATEDTPKPSAKRPGRPSGL